MPGSGSGTVFSNRLGRNTDKDCVDGYMSSLYVVIETKPNTEINKHFSGIYVSYWRVYILMRRQHLL